MLETELKFLLDPTLASAVDACLRRLPSAERSLEAHYFDTDDRRLAAAGLSLRLRKSGSEWEQTLKAPGINNVQRQEESVMLSSPAADTPPAIDPALHAGTAAGEKLLELLAREDPQPAELELVYDTRVDRLAAVVEIAGGSVEVAFDRGSIRAGALTEPVCEVEYEVVSGPPAALLEPARAGVVAFGMQLCALSKAERGDRLASGKGGAAVKAQAPQIDASMSGPALLRAIVQACVDQILGNATELAMGNTGDHVVHQLRVGIRRLRSAARELSGLDASMSRSWQAPLADAFRQLGEYRDRSTVAAALRDALDAAGSPSPSLQRTAEAAPDPRAVVGSEAFQGALLELIGYLIATPSQEASSATAVIAARLDKLHRQLGRSVKAFDRLSQDDRHQVRKRLKRLRYVAELVAPLYRSRAVLRYIDKLKPAQEALGSYNDLVVGLKMARDDAEGGNASGWFNVGWLTAQQAAQAGRCQKALATAAKAKTFWST